MDIFWSALSLSGGTGDQFRKIGRGILINICVIGILSAAGTGVLFLAPETLPQLIPLPAWVAGLVVAGVVIGLSAPSAVKIWGSLNSLAQLATSTPDSWPMGSGWIMRRRMLRTMVEYGLASVLMVLLSLLSLPLIIRLFTLGSPSIPVSILLLVLPALAVGIFSFRIHRVLEPAVQRHLHGRAG